MKRKITIMIVAGVVLVVTMLAISPTVAVGAGADDQPAISVSTISLDFGSVTVGTNSSPQHVTVTNTGNVPVNIEKSFTGDNPPFTAMGDSCQNLPPEQSCQMQVIFHPQKTDPTTVIMTLVGRPGSGSLPDSKPRIVSLTGVGV